MMRVMYSSELSIHLYRYLVRDAIKFGPLFMLAALHRGQMRPQLGVFFPCPLLHLVLPIVVRNGIVEQSNPGQVSQ